MPAQEKPHMTSVEGEPHVVLHQFTDKQSSVPEKEKVTYFTVEQMLNGLKHELLNIEELKSLCDYLNRNPDSAVAKEIRDKKLQCFGVGPTGEDIPLVTWFAGKFRLMDLKPNVLWSASSYRAALRK